MIFFVTYPNCTTVSPEHKIVSTGQMHKVLYYKFCRGKDLPAQMVWTHVGRHDCNLVGCEERLLDDWEAVNKL